MTRADRLRHLVRQFRPGRPVIYRRCGMQLEGLALELKGALLLVESSAPGHNRYWVELIQADFEKGLKV